MRIARTPFITHINHTRSIQFSPKEYDPPFQLNPVSNSPRFSPRTPLERPTASGLPPPPPDALPQIPENRQVEALRSIRLTTDFHPIPHRCHRRRSHRSAITFTITTVHHRQYSFPFASFPKQPRKNLTTLLLSAYETIQHPITDCIAATAVISTHEDATCHHSFIIFAPRSTPLLAG